VHDAVEDPYEWWDHLRGVAFFYGLSTAVLDNHKAK
jgi:hypothetical protein